MKFETKLRNYIISKEQMYFVRQRSKTKRFHACKAGRIENVRDTTNEVVEHMTEFIDYQI